MVGPVPETWAVPADGGRAFELAPNLWRLRLPLSWPGIAAVNGYALERSDGGLVLVDCGGAGDPTSWAALEAAVRDSGHALSDVREVVLTHYHSDHAGPLEWLVARSGARVLAHPAYAHFTDGAERPEEIAALRRRRSIAEGVPVERLAAFEDTREETEGIDAPVHPDLALLEGDSVRSVHGEWRVLETPGHCPSHLCLHQPEHGIVIVGDLVSEEFHPWFDYGYSADPMTETFDSLQRLLALPDPTLVLPGHGRPLEDLPGVIQMHIDEFEQRLQGVRNALAAGAQTSWEITLAVFGEDLGEVDLVLRFIEVVTYLNYDRRAGRVQRSVDAVGLIRHRLVAGDRTSAPVDS